MGKEAEKYDRVLEGAYVYSPTLMLTACIINYWDAIQNGINGW